jgi:hypothetical protein
MARVGMVPCPVCNQKNEVEEYWLLRGGEIKCGKCDANLKIKPTKTPKSHHITLKVDNGAGNAKSFDLSIGPDGVWQFGSEIERSITASLHTDSDRSAAVLRPQWWMLD